VEFEANGRKYNYRYFLADGINPRWGNFVKLVVKPKGNKTCDFHNAHATAGKDVEREFRILQAQFAIVSGPARFWDREVLWYIMNACVIMHNMIIEDKRGEDLDCTRYELMRCLMRVHWREHRVAHFIHSYHQFGTVKCMMIFKMISSRSGGDKMGNKTQKKKLKIYMLICTLNFV
jgi:hypothetical protein